MRKLIPLAVIAGAAAVGRTGRRAPARSKYWRTRMGLKLRSRRFDTEQYQQRGMYGLSTKVLVDGLELPIGAGTSDDLYVYKGSDERYYIVVVNRRLDYAGLEIFDYDGASDGDAFVDGDQVEEALGPRGVDLAPHNIARRLAVRIGE